MSDYLKNIEVMAHSLALMLAPIVVLSEDDSLDIYMLDQKIKTSIVEKMKSEYFNSIDIDPAVVRVVGLSDAYSNEMKREFDNFISDSCEQWIRRLQKEGDV